MENKWKAILFDLDGTLVDTHGLILQCYAHATHTHLQRPMLPEIWERMTGLPLEKIFRELCAHYGTEATPELIDTLKQTYRAHMRTHAHTVQAFPGVVEMLDSVRSQGYRMAIVTTKNRPMAINHLETTKLSGYFEFMITGDDVTHMKPHPEPFLRALEALQLVGREVAHVGDSQHDINGAREAGIHTIAALWGTDNEVALRAATPDHILETPSSLSICLSTL